MSRKNNLSIYIEHLNFYMMAKFAASSLCWVAMLEEILSIVNGEGIGHGLVMLVVFPPLPIELLARYMYHFPTDLATKSQNATNSHANMH